MAFRNSFKGSKDDQSSPQESQTRRFRLVRYFTMTSLGMLAIMALALTYFVVQQENFFLQYTQEGIEQLSKGQEGLTKQQDDAARSDLLAINAAGNANLAHLLENVLWEKNFAPFVASAQNIPVAACRAMADVKDEKSGKINPSSEKQACFSELGKKFMRIPGFADLNTKVYAAMRRSTVFKIKVYDLRGITVYSSEHRQIGEDKSSNTGWMQAKEGKPVSELNFRGKFSAFHGVVENRDMIHIYLPVLKPGSNQIVGVFEVYTDVTPLLQQIKKTSANIKQLSVTNIAIAEQANIAMQVKIEKLSNQALIIVLLLMLALFGALLTIVRRADTIITRQENERKQAQDEILRLNASLEERVQQRTTALAEEITERKHAEAELLQFKNILDNTLDMIFMFEPESLRFVYVNQGAVLSMGYSREELLGMTSYQIKPLLPEPEFRQLIAPLLSGEQPSLRFETIHRHKDDADFPVAILLQLVTQSDGSKLFVAIVRDTTERKKSEKIIWQQANFDTLTGLPNRRMFHDRLAQEIKKSHRSGLPMALILLDMDRFKEVNDTLGHAQGDVLLVETAQRIVECVRESDTVARLGGDEFIVILSEVEDIHSVERITQNIIERLAAPYQLLQETAFVSASAGITLYPDDALDIEALMKNADQAMYVAKTSGRNRFSYFTAALQEAAQTRLRLISDLRGALVDQQFQVFYQPIVTLANGAIHKAEALLRWQHPTRGFISPAEFIPVAEETGMIIDIGDWVFREVASQAAHWRASHYAKFQISVNISPVQFRPQGTNFKAWLDYLQELGLPGQNIVLEITEGLLLAADTSATDQLLAFRDAGIRVSLDDFGTGYSSLSYLKKFDIDYIKIDQSFVRNMADDANDRALCEAIIVMAHKLGLKVIAEGVETEQQRDLLAAYGCDYAQGWLYSKAVPPEQFEALVWGQVK